MATGTLLLLQDRIGITKKFQKLRRHTSGSAARRISKRWQTHSSQVSTLTASVLGPSYSYFFPQNPSLSFNFLSNSLYTKNDILFWTLEYTPRAGAIISKYLCSKTIFAFTKIKGHQIALRNVWELQTHKTVLILFHPNILFYQCSGSKVGLEVFPELPLLSFILKERLEVELEGL